MEKQVKYLWKNDLDQSKQFVVYYMNEKGEKISGNIVTESPTINPYSDHSIYSNATFVGIAYKFIGFHSPQNNIF